MLKQTDTKKKYGPVLFVPTLEDVLGLKVGDDALDCFGKWSHVTAISYVGSDVQHQAFVGFYTATGPTSSMSGSYKVGDLVRTVAVTKLFTSNETDDIEKYMRAKGERLLDVSEIPHTAYTSLVHSSKSGY